MKLSADTVKKVAKLANLPLAEFEEEQFTSQLSQILDYVEQLSKLDTQGIEPIFNVTEKTNITQLDETSKSLTQDQATQNSQTKNGLFITKGIFNDE